MSFPIFNTIKNVELEILLRTSVIFRIYAWNKTYDFSFRSFYEEKTVKTS